MIRTIGLADTVTPDRLAAITQSLLDIATQSLAMGNDSAKRTTIMQIATMIDSNLRAKKSPPSLADIARSLGSDEARIKATMIAVLDAIPPMLKDLPVNTASDLGLRADAVRRAYGFGVADDKKMILLGLAGALVYIMCSRKMARK
jgi:hypothetical protein